MVLMLGTDEPLDVDVKEGYKKFEKIFSRRFEKVMVWDGK